MAVLIGRGLDHMFLWSPYFVCVFFPFWSFPFSLLLTLSPFLLSFIQFLGCFFLFAPLAQLVEHLTLNQGVPGSSP